jgi:AraC-like DNA-binding protein
MPITHLAKSTNIVWRLLESYGYEPKEIFREFGIDPHLQKRTEARINFEKIVVLWKEASKITKDPCFGLKAAEHWHPSYMDALGYAWLASRTLREALRRLTSYLRIVTEGLSIEIKDSGNEVGVYLLSQLSTPLPSALVDASFAVLMRMCRANFSNDLKPAGVQFEHAASSCSDTFEDFFQAKVKFNADRDLISFHRQDTDRVLSSSNPLLAETSDQIVIRYLEKMDDENLANRVKACIVDLMPSGKISDEKIANHLHMGVRTLQRRLQAEGTTFQMLLNETRQDLAKQYLKDPTIRLEEIAFILGYSEYSVFSKAFKRWTGYSPSAYR